MANTKGIGLSLPVVFDNAFKEHKLDGTHRAPTALVQYVPIVLKASVAFDDASPKALIAVQDGDIIKRVWAEITTVWDGDGTVTLGDGTVPAGFATDVNLDKGILGYKLYNDPTLGAYLWNVANSYRKNKVYTGADTIDAVIVTGTSTQGAMDIYFEILRLK